MPSRTQRRRRSRAVTVAIAVIAVVLLLGGAAVITAALHVGPAANLLADSGVEACKSWAASASASASSAKASPSTAPGPADTTTAADYRRIRSMFTNSRYADLRIAGAHFLDLVWQAHFGGSSELALIGPLFTAYADLAGACANHGVMLPPLSSG